MICRAKFLLFVILVFGTFTQIYAAAGDLDTTFGNNGMVLTNLDYILEGISDLAVQPDGKIVAIGHGGGSASPHIIIIRYNPNGSVDTTFGTSGKVVIQSREPGELALQSDGKIVFVSPQGTSPFANFHIVRLNSDGSFDTTFNSTGTVSINLRGTDDSANSVKIQPDGKILVGGLSSVAFSSSDSDFAIIRLNPNGSLDTSFDGDGKVITSVSGQRQAEYFSNLTVRPDGKIMAVGALIKYNTNNQYDGEDFLVVSYNSNGSLDTTFDTDGIVTTQFTVPMVTRTDSYAYTVIAQSDGKILVAGDAHVYNPDFTNKAALARYNPDGSLDSSFGNGGKTIISFPPHAFSTAYDTVLQADNKIVIGGIAGNNNENNPAVARLNPDGSLDTSFSGDGFNVIQGPPNRFSAIYGIAIQPDGKIVAGGWNGWNPGSDLMLLRFQGSNCTSNCVPPREVIADFDGDGKTDLSVLRSGTWYINPSSANNPHSYYTRSVAPNPDYLTPADYDGDRKTDIAAWQTNYANTTAAFLILRSTTNTVAVTLFGITGDDPRVVGDWDGDGRADAAVYRSGATAGAQSFFYYIPSSAPETSVTIPWGIAGDEFVRGDFDGDQRADAAVYRPSNQIWYVRKSSDGQPIFQYWGLATDKRVGGDFDGDGKTDFVAYRDGIWYVLQSSDNQPRYASWGTTGDRVVAGDYDGDGKTDFAVWRAGMYYILPNSNAPAGYHNFGIPGDVPVAAAFVQ